MRKTLFILISLVLCISFALAEEMPTGYYDAVNGTKDGELKGTLKSIIRDHTAIPYGSSTWEVFYYSDRDENGYCMDMYCDDWKQFTSPGVAVSTPRVYGITSTNTGSLVRSVDDEVEGKGDRSPTRCAASFAAPRATASIGLTSCDGSFPNLSLISSCILGMREEPPTRIILSK